MERFTRVAGRAKPLFDAGCDARRLPSASDVESSLDKQFFKNGVTKGAVVAPHRPERATVERSLRARPAGTIYVDAMVFSVKTMPARVARIGDVWGEALAAKTTKQALSNARKVLEQVLDDARGPKRSRGGGEGAEPIAGRRRVRRV